ncbi:hypothetical protein NKG94_24790 [Micromonospora sp. M12]
MLFFVPAMNLAGCRRSPVSRQARPAPGRVAAGGRCPGAGRGRHADQPAHPLRGVPVWNIAFWRAPRLATGAPVVRLPKLMVGATVALVALGWR